MMIESVEAEQKLLIPVSASPLPTNPSPTTSSPSGEPISPDDLIDQIFVLHAQIASLDDLRTSDHVNALFSSLVHLCLRPCAIDIANDPLPPEVLSVRDHLIKLCGTAEGLLEHHYAALLGEFSQPHAHLNLFPYYHNYKKLAMVEFRQLCGATCGVAIQPASCALQASMADDKRSIGCCATAQFKRVAFVGSGPMPLTSIVMALHHMPWAVFDNYDIDGDANERARGLVQGHGDLRSRMCFHTCDIMQVKEKMGDYDLVFLAALVGMERESKAEILTHLGNYMRAGSTLIVRSAHGARAFLYPIVDEDMLYSSGFTLVSVFHPSDEVVNSVIVARKRSTSY